MSGTARIFAQMLIDEATLIEKYSERPARFDHALQAVIAGHLCEQIALLEAAVRRLAEKKND